MTQGMVTFIGAGPGDVELLTLKGQKALAQADVVLYAGSLVAEEILQFARPEAERLNTAGMKLEQQVEQMAAAVRQGKQVARLHTGEPSIFGALAEQTAALTAAGIPWQVIPGVSSAFAAAAALGIEYTLPETTQTVILTRMSGRTPVPDTEKLRSLAAHRSSLVIFLSTGLIREVVAELSAAGYPLDTPIALVYRASWPDEQIVRGTLENIADLAEAGELTHQGLIIISPALSGSAPVSHLYGGFQQLPSKRQGIAILALTVPAIRLGRTLVKTLPGSTLYLPQRLCEPEDGAQENIHLFQESIRQVLQSAFTQYEALVCVMAAGIVVREIAPLLKNKHTDPAVVVLDTEGRFAVSLLSGHEGGANDLAHQIAAITGGEAVITTASDVQKIPALDVLAKEYGWKLHLGSQLAAVMATLVNREPIGLVLDEGCFFPPELQTPGCVLCSDWQTAQERSLASLLWFTYRCPPANLWAVFTKIVVVHPPQLVVGVGCNRNTSAAEIRQAIEITLGEAGLALESVACLATVTAKADEAGLRQAALENGWPLEIVTPEQIQAIGDLPNPSSAAQKALGVAGVAEPCALFVAENENLLVEKHKFPNVTVAVALKRRSAHLWHR
jgi:precorrin-4 C11-methyltransferase